MSVVTYPHCNGFIIINKINCSIFRHAIFKKNGKQINPHATKQMCKSSYFIKN